MWSSERTGNTKRTGRTRRTVRTLCVVCVLCVLCVLSSCALDEITVPLGQELLVVQGIMTLDSATGPQWIIVERSLTGTVDVPDQDSLRAPPRPPLPVAGALVVVRRDDGDSVIFAEDSLGGYALDPGSARGFLLPGRVYFLRVTVPDGRVVTGRMRMPDLPVVSGMPADGAVFNRDRDTLRISWSGGGAAKGVMAQVRPRDIKRRLTLFFFTDSASFRVPGNLPLPFTGDNHPPVVWVPGTRQTFTVAAIDTNYFNFTRSGNEPFTGGGFINTVEGALGVFGGVAPVNRTYDVVGDVDHPYEGRFRLEAIRNGDSLSADLELYVSFASPEQVLVSALGRNPRGLLAPQAEGSGRVRGDTLTMVMLRDTPGHAVNQERFLLEGIFRPAGETTGLLLDEERAVIGGFRMARLPSD